MNFELRCSGHNASILFLFSSLFATTIQFAYISMVCMTCQQSWFASQWSVKASWSPTECVEVESLFMRPELPGFYILPKVIGNSKITELPCHKAIETLFSHKRKQTDASMISICYWIKLFTLFRKRNSVSFMHHRCFEEYTMSYNRKSWSIKNLKRPN